MTGIDVFILCCSLIHIGMAAFDLRQRDYVGAGISGACAFFTALIALT